jgi:hypothetical protein
MTSEEKAQFVDSVIANMESVVGIKFTHQGRSPSQGFDCIGVVLWSLLEAGYEPLLPAKALRRCYGRKPDTADLMEVVNAECSEVGVDYPLEERAAHANKLDFLLIDFKGGEAPTHMATVVTQEYLPVIIHTNSSIGRVTRHHLTADWAGLVAGVYRLKVLMEGS